MALSVRVRAWVALAIVTTSAPAGKRAARRASNSVSRGPKLEYQRAASIRFKYGKIVSADGRRGRATGTVARTVGSAFVLAL